MCTIQKLLIYAKLLNNTCDLPGSQSQVQSSCSHSRSGMPCRGGPAGDEQFGGCAGWKERTKEGECAFRLSALLLGLTSFRLSNNCCAATVVVQLLGRADALALRSYWLCRVNTESDGGQLIAVHGGCQNVLCSVYQVPLLISWASNCAFFFFLQKPSRGILWELEVTVPAHPTDLSSPCAD